jgi:hypothetical protein
MKGVPYLNLISMHNIDMLKTNRIHNSGGRLDDCGLVNLESGEFNLPVPFLGNGSIRGGIAVQGLIEPANGQLAAGRGELESENTRGGLTLVDESFEDWRRLVLADALKGQSH